MGSFKRSLFGYRRSDVDATIASRDNRIGALERELVAAAELEAEVATLSGMVIERERTIRGLSEQLQQVDRQLKEANERQDRSIASLETVSRRLEEIEAQARRQATRIRMKALSEAVEVGRRTQERVEAESLQAGKAGVGADGNGRGEVDAQSLFHGLVKVEIGPLGDFSQLVGFEDAMGDLGATQVSVERFSEGRATISMHLGEPMQLLRELEERSPLDFRVRRTASDELILDVDEDQAPEQQAA
jgi:hypothetical protein